MSSKVRGISFWTAVVVLSGPASGPARAWEGSQAEWIRAEKMRAAYVHSADKSDERLLATMQHIGMNTHIAKYDGYDFEKVREMAAAAEKQGLHFFSTAFFRGGPEIGRVFDKGGRHYVSDEGVEAARAGCPLDVRVWEATIFDRAMPLVEYSRDHPLVAGFISDVENYGAQGPFNMLGFCYCEGCLEAFFKASAIDEDTKAIPASRRKTWLQSRGRLEDFRAWEIREVERLCRGQRERVDAINADFILGALLRLQDPLAWGMAKGFATERAPLLVMPEETYGGTRMSTPEMYEQAERHGVPILLVPGIWPRWHVPSEFSTFFYLNAIMADGYWLYYEHAPLKEMLVWRQPGVPFPIRGTPEEWRRAISHLNRQIDGRLADPSYQPQLVPAAQRLAREMTPWSASAAVSATGLRARPHSPGSSSSTAPGRDRRSSWRPALREDR